MASAVTKSNTIEFDSMKRTNQQQAAALASESDQQSLRFTLGSLLQTSLDMEQVLHVFHEELTKHIQLGGTVYSNEASEINCKIGNKKREFSYLNSLFLLVYLSKSFQEMKKSKTPLI